ncbi:nucleotide disphospho-sugar-binding domain-containing protein [Amycolatopsis sp. NPDC026612]|uniref:nucleotide disphospho-sugar-binding domain-containing protein n=1 Tax=Amycolatopsis sp. NPDC026612 TaxID=3155466 RepID=UPI0033DCEAA5
MKALLLTHGSRGDVQPFAALAAALTGAGHEVVLAVPASSAAVAEPFCTRVLPLDDGTNKLVGDEAAWEAVERNFRGLRGKRLGLRLLRQNRVAMRGVFGDLAALGRVLAEDDDIDVVVHQVNVPGHAIAELLGVPAVPVCLQPFWVPTPSFADPLFPYRLPAALNEASYRSTRTFVRALTGNAARFRRNGLGLPRRRFAHDPLRRPDGTPAPVLQAFSRHVLPPWARYPEFVHTPGFFFLRSRLPWTPPAGLAAFLAAGEPPVYLGFGSMVGSDPDRTGQIAAAALRAAGVRAVVALGRGGIRPDGLGRDAYCLTQAPHDWLFPRTAAVVHHGGAGTTGAALAAGRPQVVCPFMFDQPFFGRRLSALGVAPRPQPLRELTATGLAHAITHALTGTAPARAKELGELIRAEDGTGHAVKVLEALT